MNQYTVPVEVRVWGERACFTRPEMKVERVTYPVMTPSAARGVLEAIFWKPEMRWHVEEIAVLKPVRYFSILRNEVKSVAAVRTVQSWARTGSSFDATDDRTQRHTLGLRDVAYIIRAQLHVHPDAREPDPAKYRDQFRRRVRDGRGFATPYLGCREFSAFYSEPSPEDVPLADLTGDLGPMLLDLEYRPDGSGRGQPRFFNARLEQGVLRVPARAMGER